MTATINETGQIVLPPEASEAAKARAGEEFRVLVSTSGRIMLLPRRRHLRPLADHLQGLKLEPMDSSSAQERLDRLMSKHLSKP